MMKSLPVSDMTEKNTVGETIAAPKVQAVSMPTAHDRFPGVSPAYDRRRRLVQNIFFGLFRGAAAINGIALLVIIYFMVANGWRAISWDFLTQPPMDSMTKGGILPCIVGTLCLSIGAIVVALPIGIASAIYLKEYARPARWCG